MSFQRDHQSNSQKSRLASAASQFTSRPFSVRKQNQTPTQEDLENQAFQQDRFEATQLQLKEQHSTITPVDQERLGVLQAKMDSFWTQRTDRAKAQPNLLEVLLRNPQALQTPEPQVPVQSNTIQAKSDTTGDRTNASVEQRPNKTGMPDHLKAGVESLSGYSLDHVRVHYNSPKPPQVQALAYAQGTDIHIAPGQEEHLPHEAWHVVQQAQGRVKPTMQMRGGVQVNNDKALEHEADVMGARASASTAKLQGVPERRELLHPVTQSDRQPVQRVQEKDDLMKMVEELPSLEKKGREEKLQDLLNFQLQMEKWKTADPEGVAKDGEEWDRLTSWSTNLINELTSAGIESKQPTTPMELAEAKKAVLTSMAIRITAANSRQYHSSPSEQRSTVEEGAEGTFVDFAYARQVNKSYVDKLRDKQEVTPIAPLMKGNTKKTVEKNAAVVEKNLEAVCTEFAQLAAVALDGHGIRVEIIGSMNTNHNWVLLGRPIDSDLTDPKTWGDDVAIVDCWWGAMYWESYGEMPKVIYRPWEHTDTYGNKPDASYWDSSAKQEVNAGGGLEEDFSFANLKKILSGSSLFNK